MADLDTLTPIDADVLLDGALDAGDYATAALVILSNPASCRIPQPDCEAVARCMLQTAWSDDDRRLIDDAAAYLRQRRARHV